METKAVACRARNACSRIVSCEPALLLRVDDREARIVHPPRHAFCSDQFFDVIRDAMKFLRADHEIDVRHQLKQFRAARLRHAAKKTEDHVRPALRHRPSIPILPNAFCSAMSRTLQVLRSTTSASVSFAAAS